VGSSDKRTVTTGAKSAELTRREGERQRQESAVRGAGQQSGAGCGSVFGWSGRVRSAQMGTRRTGALSTRRQKAWSEKVDELEMDEVEKVELMSGRQGEIELGEAAQCTMDDDSGRGCTGEMCEVLESTQNARTLRLAI
jgi:hypothetical protein